MYILYQLAKLQILLEITSYHNKKMQQMTDLSPQNKKQRRCIIASSLFCFCCSKECVFL